MDYQLLALIGVMIATVLVWIRMGIWRWPGQPGYEYQRVFTAGAAGLVLLAAGSIGWELKSSYRSVEGTGWVDAPIWWQVGAGIVLLLLAGYWALGVPPRPTAR